MFFKKSSECSLFSSSSSRSFLFEIVELTKKGVSKTINEDEEEGSIGVGALVEGGFGF